MNSHFLYIRRDVRDVSRSSEKYILENNNNKRGIPEVKTDA